MGRGRKPWDEQGLRERGSVWRCWPQLAYRADQADLPALVGPTGPAPEEEVAVGQGVCGRTPGLEHMYKWQPWLGPGFFIVHITPGSLWPLQRVMGKGPPAQTSRVRSYLLLTLGL